MGHSRVQAGALEHSGWPCTPKRREWQQAEGKARPPERPDVSSHSSHSLQPDSRPKRRPPTPCHGRNCSSNLGRVSAPPPTPPGSTVGRWTLGELGTAPSSASRVYDSAKECMLGSASRRRGTGPNFTFACAARVGRRG